MLYRLFHGRCGFSDPTAAVQRFAKEMSPSLHSPAPDLSPLVRSMPVIAIGNVAQPLPTGQELESRRDDPVADASKKAKAMLLLLEDDVDIGNK